MEISKHTMWGLEISVPTKELKRIFPNGVFTWSDFVHLYYWKDRSTKELSDEMTLYMEEHQIVFKGELNENEYKKDRLFDWGYYLWFFKQYPDRKRYGVEYRRALKKLIFTNKHPVIEGLRDSWYLGMKQRCKQMK